MLRASGTLPADAASWRQLSALSPHTWKLRAPMLKSRMQAALRASSGYNARARGAAVGRHARGLANRALDHLANVLRHSMRPSPLIAAGTGQRLLPTFCSKVMRPRSGAMSGDCAGNQQRPAEMGGQSASGNCTIARVHAYWIAPLTASRTRKRPLLAQGDCSRRAPCSTHCAGLRTLLANPCFYSVRPPSHCGTQRARFNILQPPFVTAARDCNSARTVSARCSATNMAPPNESSALVRRTWRF